MRGTDRQQADMYSYLSPEMRVRVDHPLPAIRSMADEELANMSERFDGMPPSNVASETLATEARRHYPRPLEQRSSGGNNRLNFRFGRPAAERRPERFYSTSTTARIQGWMQHWNLCTPGESPLSWTALPGATTTGDARQVPAWTNGTVPAGPPTPLRNGTNPPPNAATSVKVWPSPPAFVTRTVCPDRIEMYPGAKFHAGCPMMFAASGENSIPMNSAKVVS
jgi:hypothetical protein